MSRVVKLAWHIFPVVQQSCQDVKSYMSRVVELAWHICWATRHICRETRQPCRDVLTIMSSSTWMWNNLRNGYLRFKLCSTLLSSVVDHRQTKDRQALSVMVEYHWANEIYYDPLSTWHYATNMSSNVETINLILLDIFVE